MSLSYNFQNNYINHRFNSETGLWEYSSFSPHPPAADGSECLQLAMQQRLMINDITTGRDPDGFLYTGEGGTQKVLLPQAPPPSCKCGVSEYGEFVRKTNEVFCVKKCDFRFAPRAQTNTDTLLLRYIYFTLC